MSGIHFSHALHAGIESTRPFTDTYFRNQNDMKFCHINGVAHDVILQDNEKHAWCSASCLKITGE